VTDLATGPVFTDAYWADPYGTLSRLREIAPVREVDLPDGGSTWLLTRYADVRAAFVDPRLAKDFRSTMPPEQRPAEPLIPGPAGHMLLLNDPPVHTRLRKLVVSTFTVRRIAALRPAIEQIATTLLDRAEQAGEIDLVNDYAVPLPMQVICELLGVPLDDRDAFALWSRTMIDDTSTQPEKHQAQASLTGYLSELVAAKRDAPDEALLSALIRASEDGDALSHDEIVAMGMILLIAGHETTSNLIVNSVHAILRDDALRERVLGADSLAPVVEEFLRWTSPVANAPVRFATEDIEMDGVTIPRGALVTLSVAAANRDPQRFDAPELYDTDRDLTGHVAFGHGIHFCLGASLARLEGEIALTALFGRFPHLAPAVPLEEIVYRHSMLIHALAALPVRLSPGS
jgi:vitamin D3 1,25-hydroxylase